MLPEAVVWTMAFIRLVESVVECCDEQDDVRKTCGNSVEKYGLIGKLLAPCERVAAA